MSQSPGRPDLRPLVGAAAVVFPLLYFVSDIVEVAQGDFTTFRLTLTYLGEAAIPFFVVGLFAVARPGLGWLGLSGALAYGYAFVFFSATVVFALAGGAADWEQVTRAFGPWLTVHGAIMLLGGVAFGAAVLRTAAYPRWTGIALILGVVLVAAAASLPNAPRAVAAALPQAAFVGMGVTLLLGRQRARPGAPVGGAQ